MRSKQDIDIGYAAAVIATIIAMAMIIAHKAAVAEEESYTAPQGAVVTPAKLVLADDQAAVQYYPLTGSWRIVVKLVDGTGATVLYKGKDAVTEVWVTNAELVAGMTGLDTSTPVKALRAMQQAMLKAAKGKL
jgi:hypothetical protein